MNDPQNMNLELQLEEKIQGWVAENEEDYEEYFTINVSEFRNNSFMLILNDTNIIKITLVDLASNDILLETKNKNEEFKAFVKNCQEMIKKSTPDDICAMLKLICDQYKYSFMSTAGGDDKFDDPKPNLNQNYVEEVKQDVEEEKLMHAFDLDNHNLGSPRIPKYHDNSIKESEKISTFSINVSKDLRASQIQTQRLIKEYKNLVSSPEFCDYININYSDRNMREWRVSFDLTHWEEMPPKLASQFSNLKFVKGLLGNERKLQYEVQFPDEYPFVPPKIYMISPQVKHATGFVLLGGALCLESLTPKGWCMKRTLENLFVEIISLLEEGDAIFEDCQRPLNSLQAQEIFDVNALQMGWAVTH